MDHVGSSDPSFITGEHSSSSLDANGDGNVMMMQDNSNDVSSLEEYSVDHENHQEEEPSQHRYEGDEHRTMGNGSVWGTAATVGVKKANSDNMGNSYNESSSSSSSFASATIRRSSNRDNAGMSYLPPEGFTLAAHVIVSEEDGLSYFASDPISHIPFTDCGPILGSLTEQLTIRHMTIRHFPAKAETVWNTFVEPQMIVCLHPLQVVVSGNDHEVRTFQAGDVLLFEDHVGKGHKFRSAPVPEGSHNAHQIPSFEDQSVSVISFSLPHHRGVEDTLGLERAESSRSKRMNDCSQDSGQELHDDVFIKDEGQKQEMHRYQVQEKTKNIFGVKVPIRRALVGATSIGLSSIIVTLKLTQFIPAKISAGIGQVVLAAGGAGAMLMLVDYLEKRGSFQI